MKAQSHLWLWQFGSYLRYGVLGSCICSTLVSVHAMKGIPIGPLARWGKDLTYYLTPFICQVNWDMHYPGSACRGTDLPSGRLLYIHIGIFTWLTSAGLYKAMICRAGELAVDHIHTFLTTQGHGLPRWVISWIPGPPPRQDEHFIHSHIHYNQQDYRRMIMMTKWYSGTWWA